MKFPNGKQISPCILSKVRHALDLKKEHPQNSKTCSKDYWNNVCRLIGKKMRLSPKQIEDAIEDYNHYMQLRYIKSSR